MPLRLRFDNRAEIDLDGIHEWVSHRADPETATAYVDRIIARCERLLEAPRGGRPRGKARPVIRSVPFERSALILYRIGRSDLIIVRVLRRGRDADAILRRR